MCMPALAVRLLMRPASVLWRELSFKIRFTTEERSAFPLPSSSRICGTDDMDFLRPGNSVRVVFEEPQKVTYTESDTNAVWDCKCHLLRCSSTAKTLCPFICLLNYSSLKVHLDQGFSNLLDHGPLLTVK